MRSLMCLIAAATCSPAVADLESHEVAYTWSVLDGNEPTTLTFPLFDTMGGVRQLTGVTVGLEGALTLDMNAENQEEESVGEGEWFVESALFMQLAFDTLDLGGVTGVGLGVFSADLGANDGIKGSGPDFVKWSYDDDVSALVEILEGDFGAFEGEGDLGAELYPFLSLALSAPPPLVFVDVADHQHSGAVTLTYEFVTVPAPGALGVLGLGLVWRRRR